MIINAIKVSTRGRTILPSFCQVVVDDFSSSLDSRRGGGNRSRDVCAKDGGSSRLIGCSPNYERIMVSLLIWARFCTVNREWRELSGGLCKCVQRKIEVFNVWKDFLRRRAMICVWIYKTLLVTRVLLSDGGGARLIEIVTNRRRHARWRWNYIDECMFVQLTRPSPSYMCTLEHGYVGFWNRVFDDVIIPFAWNLILQSMRGNCLFLSNLCSLIKNWNTSIFFFFVIGTYEERV